MIVTIVAIATIVQKFDWTIVTVLTIHGFHMIVAIAEVFMVECIKADDGYSVFTSVATDTISLNSWSIRSPLKLVVIFLCFMKIESHSNLANSLCPGTTSRNRFCPFEVSSTPYQVIIFLYLIRLLKETLRISR